MEPPLKRRKLQRVWPIFNFCDEKNIKLNQIISSLTATPQLEKEGTSGDFSTTIEQTQVFQDEEGLIFTGDVVDGKPVIKGGTIQKLVERLTYEKDTGFFIQNCTKIKKLIGINLFSQKKYRSKIRQSIYAHFPFLHNSCRIITIIEKSFQFESTHWSFSR